MQLIIDVPDEYLHTIRGEGVNKHDMARLVKKELSSAGGVYMPHEWEQIFLHMFRSGKARVKAA